MSLDIIKIRTRGTINGLNHAHTTNNKKVLLFPSLL